jgi:hypothetical protein
MEDSEEYVVKQYICPICKATHEVTLAKDLAANRTKFPFPYVYLHSREQSGGELQDLLTILYIDANLQVRGTEIILVEGGNIFSAELTRQITDKLTDRIAELEEENVRLKNYMQFQSDSDFLATDVEDPGASEEEIDIKIEELSKETDKMIGELLEGLADVELLDDSPEPVFEDIEIEEISPRVKKPSRQKQIKPRIKVKTPAGPKKSKITTVDLFVASTIGPYGEKRQKLTINARISVDDLKETVGNLFGLDPSVFYLALNGVTLNDTQYLNDYNVTNNDELLIIPASTAGI